MTPQLSKELSLRRQKFFGQLDKNCIVVLYSGTVVNRNADNEYPFRPSSDFYYLTGVEEAEAVAVFIPGELDNEYILFTLPRNPEQERWTGKRIGQEKACKIYGANQAFALEILEEKLVKLFTGKKTVFYALDDPAAQKVVHAVLKKLPYLSRTNLIIPQQLENISPIIRELRLFKSDYEIDLMRQAAQISVKGHEQAMKVCRPELFEYQLEAELKYIFTQQGSKFEAYPSIVASGNNACTLHYNTNTEKLIAGDLVLIDAGCEYQYYASDITRTFPITGKFTETQRKVYQIVLDAQLAGIAEIKPGNSWTMIQTATVYTITKGLIDLGILSGNLDTLIAEKAYQRFYLHSSGHWLGLDTHDPSSYQVNGKPRLLEPGMVLTVEPGIYIPSEYHDVDPKWRGIGIRIEDDVLVTATGADVLSKGLAKSIDEIETLMNT